jgi:transposase
MARKAYQTDLIDKEWLLIEALLPARQSTKGCKSTHDRREILRAFFVDAGHCPPV